MNNTLFVGSPEAMTIKVPDGPTKLTIKGKDKGVLVEIDVATGKVEFGPNYDLDETARVFFTALGGKIKDIAA